MEGTLLGITEIQVPGSLRTDSPCFLSGFGSRSLFCFLSGYLLIPRHPQRSQVIFSVNHVINSQHKFSTVVLTGITMAAFSFPIYRWETQGPERGETAKAPGCHLVQPPLPRSLRLLNLNLSPCYPSFEYRMHGPVSWLLASDLNLALTVVFQKHSCLGEATAVPSFTTIHSHMHENTQGKASWLSNKIMFQSKKRTYNLFQSKQC